jgi:PAS domain S-box-containing protein
MWIGLGCSGFKVLRLHLGTPYLGMVGGVYAAYDFAMATEVIRPGLEPRKRCADIDKSETSPEPKYLNLPEHADSAELRQVLDALPALVFLERAGRIVYANTEARQMIGCVDSEWVERPIEEVLWGLFPGTAEPKTELTGTRKGSPFHATMPAKCGRLTPVEGTYSITNKELREAVIVAHPSGRERAPKTRLMEDVLASIPEAVVIEHGGHVLYTNPAFSRMFGYSVEEACGGSVCELIVPESRVDEHAMLAQSVREQGSAAVETTRRTKAGDAVSVHLLMAPLEVNGAAVGFVCTFREAGEAARTA